MKKVKFIVICLAIAILAPILIVSTKQTKTPLQEAIAPAEDGVIKLAQKPEQPKAPEDSKASKDTTINLQKSLDKTEQAKKTTRTITLKNNVERSMLGYQKFGTHYPSNFSISIDGNNVVKVNSKEIEKKEDTVTLAVKENDTIKIRYDYEFGSYKTGANVVEFKLPSDKNTYDLAFSWKDDNRIIIEGTEVVSKTAVEV